MKHSATHAKLLVVVVIWGLGWVAGVVVSNEETGIPPFAAGWARYVLAIACFLTFLKITNQWILPNRDQWKIIFMMGFLSTFLYQAFFMYGMRYTAAGDASLMITFNPPLHNIARHSILGREVQQTHRNRPLSRHVGRRNFGALLTKSKHSSQPQSAW